MQKILKLSAVSLLVIVATTNANAAGYTCENLIEYTSCNDGYELSMAECVDIPTCNAGAYALRQCPDGYILETGVCVDGSDASSGNGFGDCQYDAYYEYACRDETGNYEPVVYACESCPSTGLVDPNNNPILATTNTGATSVAECYVKPGVDIKGEHGTYHFKSNCISVNPGSIKTAADCEWLAAATGEDWIDYGSRCEFSPTLDSLSTVIAPKTESECLEVGSYGDSFFENGICGCSTWFIEYESGKLDCELS